MTTINNLIDLLTKHLQGNLSDAEQEQLNQWLSQSEQNRRLFASIDDEEQMRQLILSYHQEEVENNEAIILSKVRKGISEGMPVAPVRRISSLQRWGWVAALALLLAGIGGYLLLNSKKDIVPVVKVETPADIPPGKDGAILTLADGRQVVLDSLGNGVITTQNGTQVVLKNKALAYTMGARPAAPVYNTLTTPKGRQFQLILPDGTKVWLNAASSLRYPTVFSGSERLVVVTGEVYFEVVRNTKMPFKITIPPRPGAPGEAEVEVLGTRFNVNAYANETAITTTLIEGKVKFNYQPATGSAKKQSAILKPGAQAVLTHDSRLPNGTLVKAELTIRDNADVDKAVAWKSGFFNFEDASLEEVMRQLERWYDIEVVYEKAIPDIRFGGKMSNDVSLSGLLKSLQEMEVHFRIEGRKLIVLP
ncbi:FecR family protein [Niastella caeni]|nr:FecR family protein [Niastella caeni]